MTSTERLEAIAAMYVRHDNDLHQLVMARGSQNPQIVDDACAHGWTQLVAGEHIDLRPPRWQALAYVTTCALRHAWLLNRAQQRAQPTENSRVTELVDEQDTGAGADELVALRLRLQLVAQLPERPRRFLLRQALGYSYDEIAAAENTTWRTTERQLARAKRLLRQLDAATAADAPAQPGKK